MSELKLIARSPITPAPPLSVEAGWEVSGRRSSAALRIIDCTPLAKVQVRATPDGVGRRLLGIGHGHAARDPHGALVVGSGPGEWLLLSEPGTAAKVIDRLTRAGGSVEHDEGLVTITDLTHGRALIRLVGAEAPRLLAKVCGIDFADRITPDGAAFRSSVARLVTDVVRDDHDRKRSYLLHCERSSGRYLFDALLDAGEEFGIDIDGFQLPGI